MSVSHIHKSFLFVIPLVLLFTLRAGAQGNIPRETMMFIYTGDKYFEEEQYTKAADFYKRALDLDTAHVHAHYHLAECYRKTFAYDLAIPHYQQVIETGLEAYPVVLFYYPLAQKLDGKFASAEANFMAFISYAGKHPFEGSSRLVEKAKIEKEGCRYAMAQLTELFSDYGFTHPGASLNSIYNDYAPWILHNDSSLVFTSGRPAATGKLENNRYGEYFSDNFRYAWDSTGWQPVKDTDNFDATNSQFIEGAGSFNRDKTKFYFTGCEAKDGCKIYVSVKNNGKWGAPEMLNKNINAEGEDAKQPSLSPGADTLFFVSGRPGGFGGNDIWMSVSDSAAESWGPPVNLGRKINTPFNETSPFFYGAKNLLFFSSDGLRGFGGLDIFVATGSTFLRATVHNMGFPFNSNSNDSYLVMGESHGYLASNRPGSLGGFDIYRYEMTAARAMINEVTNAGSGGRVLYCRVRNLSGSDILVMRDEDKFYYRNLPPSEKERVDRIIAAKLAALKGYGEKPLSTADKGYFQELSREEQAGITRIARLLYESRRHNVEQLIRPEERRPMNTVLALDKRFVAHTGLPVGRDSISWRGMDAVTIASASSKMSAFAKTSTPGKNDDKPAEAFNPQFESIYFDLDRAALRPEARKVLDEIMAYYQENPDIRISLSVYSDSTGTNPYNLALSKKRGDATRAYLVKSGLPQEILQVKALGNEDPVASNNTRAGRQMNRRIAFDITGASRPYDPEVATYITKTTLTLLELAELTQNTVEELQQYNGLATMADIQVYTPVRIRIVKPAREMEAFLLKTPFP